MSERGLSFCAELIPKVLDGTKGQTRRCHAKPRFVVGDTFYIRETWHTGIEWDDTKPSEVDPLCGGNDIWYVADGPPPNDVWGKKRPSIFMPKWAARLERFRVTRVRGERVQDISEEDAVAEGSQADSTTPEIWWQGYDGRYKDCDGNRLHTQVPRCDAPPEWLLEPHKMLYTPGLGYSAKRNFECLWDSLAKPGFTWNDNPMVFAYDFERGQGQ